MKKIILIPVQQWNDRFMIAKIDPRILVNMIDDIQVGEAQEAQRPLDEKHLKEIADYVASGGNLPSSVIASTKKNEHGNMLSLQKESIEVIHADGKSEHRTEYYIEVPETPEELDQWKGTIDLIDGQHRVVSFRDEYRNARLLKDSVVYEIGISLYNLPTLKKRQELFMTTNEKQKAVDGNLLMWLRNKLGLLSDAEIQQYPLVEMLGKEQRSPLYRRIIFNAEPIKKGYKAREMVKILNRSFKSTMMIGSKEATNEQRFQAICVYLEGWEAAYGYRFSAPGKETMTKISGLRYIMWLFEFFWASAVDKEHPWDIDFIVEMIQNMQQATGRNNLFNESLYFRGEGATSKVVDMDINAYKNWAIQQKNKFFNPLAGCLTQN